MLTLPGKDATRTLRASLASGSETHFLSFYVVLIRLVLTKIERQAHGRDIGAVLRRHCVPAPPTLADAPPRGGQEGCISEPRVSQGLNTLQNNVWTRKIAACRADRVTPQALPYRCLLVGSLKALYYVEADRCIEFITQNFHRGTTWVCARPVVCFFGQNSQSLGGWALGRKLHSQARMDTHVCKRVVCKCVLTPRF